jgi:pyruvate,water dikinase
VLSSFVDQFGDLSCTTGSGSECQYGETAIIQLLLEFSNRPGKSKTSNEKDIAVLKDIYLNRFEPDRRDFAKEVLQLGRESYRLRDDDNIHLGRIEARLFEAVQEGQKRLVDPSSTKKDMETLAKIPALSLTKEDRRNQPVPATDKAADQRWVLSRQIVGQPAGPGIASGRARLIKTPQDLLSFKQGDILVCQGVDPNMTFVVPLAAGVVEERGGMLIHGAIIAREYGLPCITGASGVMKLIENGNQITVDGYLGIITCQTNEL